MEITTLVFLAFVAVSCFFYYIAPKKLQWVVLLLASLVFFVMSSALLTGYMLAATAVTYAGALLIQRYKNIFAQKKKELKKEERKKLKAKLKRKQIVILFVTAFAVLSLLAATKYCNFIGEIINSTFGLFGSGVTMPHFKILLPLGISYYTLMSISYAVDVHRGAVDAEKNPLRLLLFVCYFPHIVEGPFDRYKALNEQFKAPHRFDYDSMRKGLLLILFGFFQKLVIADGLGLMVEDGFKSIEDYSGAIVIAGTMLYTFQLYMDFSGCINIVSGVSELFGIKLAENFRQPFFSRSIDEFWRRWHISLGAWLREYVFYPISLSKNFKKMSKSIKKHTKSAYLSDIIPLAFALFFVWFCNGLWHGASVKYIVYGLYYYVLMMLGRVCEPLFAKSCSLLRINRNGKFFAFFQMVRTFVIVNIGMLLFTSKSLKQFAELALKAVTSFNFEDFADFVPEDNRWMVIAFGMLAVLVIGILKERGADVRSWLVTHTFVLRWSVYLFLIAATLICGIYGPEYGEAGGIYAQF